MGQLRSKQELIQMSASGKFTEEEMREITINSVPSLWAETNLSGPDNLTKLFPLELQDTQRDICDNPNKLKSIRMGRGWGKTVAFMSYCFWECATEPGIDIFYYLPGKSQIERVYTVMENMLYDSPAAEMINKESITKQNLNKKEQIAHVVSFKNGSKITFFICDQKIDKIRSHHNPKAIIIDEAAMIKPEAITAIVGILTSSSGILWAASTPKGRVGWFYTWCLKSDVIHYHKKSSEAAHWSAAKELAARTACDTEAMYLQEFDAEFSDDAETIYPDKLIEKAVIKTYRHNGNIVRKDYNHYTTFLDQDQMYREYGEDRLRLTIGIDWNQPNAGVRIAHLLETKNNQLVLLKTDKISHEKFTQLQAVQRIIEIYNTMYPDAIYCDIGFGVTQCEMLYEWAEENKETRFIEIFKPIDFSKPIIFNEEEAPYKRKKTSSPEDEAEEYKVRTKNYMISLVYNSLKEERLTIPIWEDNPETQDGLVQEMRQFKLKFIGANGEPVYSKEGGQHSHFALGLAVLGNNDVCKNGNKPKETTAGAVGIIPAKEISQKPTRLIDPGWEAPQQYYSQKDFEMDKEYDTGNSRFSRKFESRKARLI